MHPSPLPCRYTSSGGIHTRGRPRVVRNGSGTWLAVCSVGFALVLTLNAFTLWGVEDLLGAASAWPWAAAEMRAWCLPANVLTFAAYGLASLRLPSLSARRPTSPACICLALGAAALLAACLARDPHLPLFQLAGVLLGCGGALAFVCWEFTLTMGPVADARKALLLASVITAAPYLALVFVFRGAVVYPLTCALVPACVASLLVARARIPKPPASCAPAACPDASQARRLWADAWMPLACVMMIGVVGPATGQFASIGSMSESLRLAMYQLANVVAAAALALAWFRLHARVTIPRTFLVLVPLVGVALFLFPFWTHWFQAFVLTLGCCMFSLASILMMTLCLDLSRTSGVGLGAVYGLFAACTYLAQIMGGSLARIVGASAYPAQFQVVAVVALLLWGLSAIALVVMWRARTVRGEARGASGRNVAPNEPASSPAADPVTRACELLRRRFDLTPREVDVLELLGRGRDVSVVAETLGVSRNTVRSHVQRLYADTGVHDRQELIDLVEAAALESEAPTPATSADPQPVRQH